MFCAALFESSFILRGRPSDGGGAKGKKRKEKEREKERVREREKIREEIREKVLQRLACSFRFGRVSVGYSLVISSPRRNCVILTGGTRGFLFNARDEKYRAIEMHERKR